MPAAANPMDAGSGVAVKPVLDSLKSILLSPVFQLSKKIVTWFAVKLG